MCLTLSVREWQDILVFPGANRLEGVCPGQVTRFMCVCVHLSSVNNTPSFMFLFSRCTRKEKCERSSEPRRFASDIKQCVRLSVHPNNISVSQFSVTVSGNTLFFTLLWSSDNNDQGPNVMTAKFHWKD